MGMNIEITAADGHKFAAYRVNPEGSPRGAIVVVQEAFGVNAHIRRMADTYASEGYLAIAPALYDRIERGVEVGYTGEDRERGISCMKQSNFDDVLKDVAATQQVASEGGKVGINGWCWGGSVAWLAACQLDGFTAAVSNYGGRVPDFKTETPRCPLIFNWGETDASIPMDKVRTIEAQHPDIPSYVYPAGHGFTCDDRDSFHAESAALAHQRTMAFFAEHL